MWVQSPIHKVSWQSTITHMDVSKNRGKTTKMDGENNGKPYYNGILANYYNSSCQIMIFYQPTFP